MRLPAFLTNIAPLGQTMAAMDRGTAWLAADTARRNAQLTPATADRSLTLWEQEYGLSRGSDDTELRRARIRAAMCGRQTLTRSRLEQLAVTVGGADLGRVAEDFPARQVTLFALYRDSVPESTAALERAADLLKPAHLQVQVINGCLLTHHLPLMLGVRGGVQLQLNVRQAEA